MARQHVNHHLGSRIGSGTPHGHVLQPECQRGKGRQLDRPRVGRQGRGVEGLGGGGGGRKMKEIREQVIRSVGNLSRLPWGKGAGRKWGR